MKLWRFFLVHSLRDMIRNRQRTLFALFCVAAGVAIIVALRMLGLMIEDALTANVAAAYHGDIRISVWRQAPRIFSSTDDERSVISEHIESDIREWTAERDIVVTGTIRGEFLQLAPVVNGQPARVQMILAHFIEPDLYPLYMDVRAIEPENVPLRHLLVNPEDIVLADNLASRLNINLGDQVRLGQASDFFTVRGIIPTETEATTDGYSFMGVMLGYVYLSIDQASLVQYAPRPDTFYLQLPEGTDLQETTHSLRRRFQNSSIQTRDTMLDRNEFLIGLIGDFILVMGLVAVVVGGVGIINTMLVVVSRRTTEIAVLKTLGLKGRQITTLFLVEAVLMGIIGSLVGIILGLAFSFLAQQVGEATLLQPLRWRLHPDPLLLGAAMGIVITAVFGFLPTLAAARVRPATVLRPSNALLPRAGITARMITLAIFTVILGIILSNIVGDRLHFFVRALPSEPQLPDPLVIGLVLAVIGMLSLGALVVLFWVVVWLVSKFPSFGLIDIRLAFRFLTTKRTRTASALLVLTGGIFALSLISLMTTTANEFLNLSLTQQLGGNIVAVSFLPGSPLLIEQALAEQTDITYAQLGSYTASLRGINGREDFPELIDQQLEEAQADNLYRMLSIVVGRDVHTAPFLDVPMLAGRSLGPEDAGQPVIVLPGTEEVQLLGWSPGDVVRLQVRAFNRSVTMDFEIVGITLGQQELVPGLSTIGTPTMPLDSLNIAAMIYPTIIDAEADALNETLNRLADVPALITIEVEMLNTIFQRVLEQLSAIPLLVTWLALFAGATIIANTFSLATLERKRQIGIMKAIGMKSGRVLRVLLLENVIIGFIGGLVGIGVSALVTWFATSVGNLLSGAFMGIQPLLPSFSVGQIVVLLGLAIGIAVFATILTAWRASREKPMNVLRYE